jgi:hypothetical protein
LAPMFTLGDHDRALRAKALAVRDGRLDVEDLLEHARQVLRVDPPRTLQEFNSFRSAWVGPLKDTGFTALQVDHLLGYETPIDGPGRSRAKGRVRKAYKRQTGSVRAPSARRCACSM